MLSCAAWGVFFGANAQASIAVIPITDIGAFPDYTVNNTGQSYAGTGFVGMYPSTDRFAHLFGVEQSGFSRTAMEADIAFLSGATINSAVLSFNLLSGSGTQNLTVTSFTADGTLEYFWNSPDNLGSVVASADIGANSIDVTGLVQSQATASASWLGLHVQGSTRNQWTYTYTGYGYGADSANVRLTIDYDAGTSAVPEPASAAVWGLLASVCGIGAVIKCKRASA